MSTGVETVSPDDRMEEISGNFESGGHFHFPVCDKEDGSVVGVISRTDYLRLQHSMTEFGTEEARLSNARLLHSMLVRDIMTHPAVTISPDLSLKEAAAQFRNRNFHCFPVVEDGRLLGMITVMDLLHYAYDEG